MPGHQLIKDSLALVMSINMCSNWMKPVYQNMCTKTPRAFKSQNI